MESIIGRTQQPTSKTGQTVCLDCFSQYCQAVDYASPSSPTSTTRRLHDVPLLHPHDSREFLSSFCCHDPPLSFTTISLSSGRKWLWSQSSSSPSFPSCETCRRRPRRSETQTIDYEDNKRTMNGRDGMMTLSSSSTTRRWTSSTLNHHQPVILLVVYLILILLPFSTLASDCRFPPDWSGKWFQKGIPDPIRISEGDISEKGFCREISGDKFLIENRHERCVRCMVINQKHTNVLQYKETFCLPYSRSNPRSLREVCADINGDASLFSLFRLDTPPVSCPFSGPFVFSYSRGQGECREPLSTMDSCTDDTRLLLRFQACADVGGSESRVEELSCLGEWKEGSTRYLVGRMEHRNAKTDEDKFRCFVFEKRGLDGGSVNIAQSGDATCDGLSSPLEGSRTMKLNKRPDIVSSCSFPKWLTGPRHWKTLDGSAILDFTRNTSFITFNMSNAVRLGVDTCIRPSDPPPSLQSMGDVEEFVVHSASGCKIGYMCLRMYRRNNHIVEIESGSNLVKDPDYACMNHQVFSRFLSITTFNPALDECPLEGIFSVEVPGEDDNLLVGNNFLSPMEDSTLFVCSDQSVLTSKCSTPTHMQLLSKCSDTTDSARNLYCHGNWRQNGSTYTIVSSSEDKKQYCLVFRGSNPDNLESSHKLKMHINSGSCPHPLELSGTASTSTAAIQPFSHVVKRGVLSLNLVDHGKCQSLTSASTGYSHIKSSSSSSSSVIIMIILLTLNSLFLLLFSAFMS